MMDGPAPAAADRPRVEFKRLAGNLRRGAFVCGEDEIDRWTRDACNNHRKLKSRVWAAHLQGNPAVAGIYSLRIRLEPDSDIEGARPFFRPENGQFAAVHLCHLGVQRPLQRRGIGEIMMGHAIEQFARVADQTAICAMTLVAINGEKADWYQKLGFRPYGAECQQPKLFLPAQSALDMITWI